MIIDMQEGWLTPRTIDVYRSAELIINELLAVKPNEQIAIVCDPHTEMSMAYALAGVAEGIGAEYTILLMERYYEERKLGEEPSSAIEIASKKIGLAIFSSGLTTMGGFAALLLSSYPFIRNFGMVIVIDVALCLLSTIVVLPPLIVAIDKAVIRWKKRRGPK